MRYASGWMTDRGGLVTQDRADTVIVAWCEVAGAAIDERRRGHVVEARRLAKQARRIVRTFGVRTWKSGPVVGHA